MACCQRIRGWFLGFKDMFNWFKVLQSLDDEKMLKINGADYALYLVYLRYAAYLCAGIFAFDLVVMVPLYQSGDPMEADDYRTHDSLSSMNAITVLNITANKNKMIFAYVVAVFIVPSFAFFMLYKFI